MSTVSTTQHPRTALVTGANSGIGFFTAKALAEQGYSVTLACRNPERGRVAQERILDVLPDAQIDVMHLDLASLRSVKAFAADYLVDHQSWDILVNNAAAKVVPERLLTEDGFEWHFGVNFLGHFALTGLLMPNARVDARVVTLTSLAARNAKLRFHDLRWDNGYRPGRAYAMSKLADLIFARELNRRCHDEALADYPATLLSVAAHPGLTVPVRRSTLSPSRVFGHDPSVGAESVVAACIDPDLKGGELIAPSGSGQLRGRPGPVDAPAIPDENLTALRLWRIAAQLTRIPW